MLKLLQKRKKNSKSFRYETKETEYLRNRRINVPTSHVYIKFIFTDLPWITVTLAMLGRLSAAACFAVFYVQIGELLPTVLRAQAMGASSFIAGVGLLACPYIVYLVSFMFYSIKDTIYSYFVVLIGFINGTLSGLHNTLLKLLF